MGKRVTRADETHLAILTGQHVELASRKKIMKGQHIELAGKKKGKDIGQHVELAGKKKGRPTR